MEVSLTRRRVLLPGLVVLLLAAIILALLVRNKDSTQDFAAPWQLNFSLTGGFVGYNLALTLLDDGQMSWEDRRDHSSGNLILPSSDLDQLGRHMLNAEFFSQRSSPTGLCCDSFDYLIEFKGAHASHVVTANSFTANARLKPLLRWLEMLAFSRRR